MSKWDHEVDLLVFGAGTGGMAAALFGAHEGLAVLLCEKSGQVGGTTATSAGTAWVPGNRQSVRVGVPDTIDDGRRYLEAELGNALDRELCEAFLAAGPDAIDYLETRTEVKFAAAVRHPDYHPDRPGRALGGRALGPLPFDARVLGEDFKRVRAPMAPFMAFGGMMVARDEVQSLCNPLSSVAAFRLTMRRLGRYAADRLRHHRGTHLIMGNALVARFLLSLRRKNVPIWFDAPLTELVREDGRIIGAVVKAEGTTRRVRARRAVVLATGGFPASKGLREELMNGLPVPLSLPFSVSSGDAIMLARAAGAALDKDHMSPAFWMPTSILKEKDGSRTIFPHIVLDRAKPGLIAVNSAGLRFVNEADSYHDFVMGMFASHKTVPTMPAWLICDRSFIRDYGIGLVRPGMGQPVERYVEAGYLIRADTLSELGARIGVDAGNLEKSVAEHNRFAQTGVDEAFGKGSTELNRNNGDAANKPNPCLRPIRQPPYFAVAVYPADLATSVGLKTDGDARVLDALRRPIEGLYAVGNDMASMMRGAYPGPGTTIGPAIAFAYRAVMSIKRDKEEQAAPKLRVG